MSCSPTRRQSPAESRLSSAAAGDNVPASQLTLDPRGSEWQGSTHRRLWLCFPLKNKQPYSWPFVSASRVSHPGIQPAEGLKQHFHLCDRRFATACLSRRPSVHVRRFQAQFGESANRLQIPWSQESRADFLGGERPYPSRWLRTRRVTFGLSFGSIICISWWFYSEVFPRTSFSQPRCGLQHPLWKFTSFVVSVH